METSYTGSGSTSGRGLDHPALFWIALTAAVVSLAVGVSLTLRSSTALDFSVYYMAADLIHHGRSPYTIDRPAWDALAQSLHVHKYAWPYRYSPHTAVLVMPLLPLGIHWAMVVWTLVNASGFLAGALIAGAALGGRREQMLALWLLACFGPVFNSYGDGQVEGIAFLGLALAFWGLARRRPIATGLGVAVGAVLKLVPLVLLLYLLWRRRWREAVWAAVATVALTLACLPVTGTGLFTQWAGRAADLTAPGRINVNPPNQTVTGVVGRLLLDRTSFGDGAREQLVRGLALAFAAVLLAATAFATWPRRRDPAGPALPARPPDTGVIREDLVGFGMVLAASSVVGPFTYYHQFSWLLIPTALLVVAAVHRGSVASVLGWFALVVLLDVDYALWVAARDTLLATGIWRLLSVPFVYAAVVWWNSWRQLRPDKAPVGEATADST